MFSCATKSNDPIDDYKEKSETTFDYFFNMD